VLELRHMEKSKHTTRIINLLKRAPQKVKPFIPKKIKKIAKKYVKSRNKKRDASSDRLATLKYRLYNLGFTNRAIQDIEMLFSNSATSLKTRVDAAWELAVWYTNLNTNKGAKTALKHIEFVEKNKLNSPTPSQVVIMKVECYNTLNKTVVSNKVLKEYLNEKTDENVQLMFANNLLNADEKIDGINHIFESHGVSGIKLINGSKKTYDRLSGKKFTKTNSKSDVKVSVIVPVYNAATYLSTALNSIMRQSWENLEIIIVDDCSTDETARLVRSYMKKDARIKFIKNDHNSGPYVSRNNALAVATGDFITVNDSDDWSHPEKIQIQAQTLIDNPNSIGSISHWARATDDLHFYRRGNPGFFIQLNISSLMLRRKELVENFGSWDSVRFGADTELYHRIKRKLGPRSIVETPPIPLSFGRHAEDSLTTSSAFGYPGYLLGARKIYSESTAFNLRAVANLRFPFSLTDRRFYAPQPMIPTYKKGSVSQYDMLFVADFTSRNAVSLTALKQIKELRASNTRIGIVQTSSYEKSFKKPPIDEIMHVLNSGFVEYLVYGETVETEYLIADPEMISEEQKYLPSIHATHSVLLTNGFSKKLDIKLIESDLKRRYKSSVTWCVIDNKTTINEESAGRAKDTLFYPLSWQDMSGHIYAPSFQNIKNALSKTIKIRISKTNPFYTGSEKQIHIVKTDSIEGFRLGENEITIVMPCIDLERGTETANLLVQRAGIKCNVVVALDTKRQGFIKTLNEIAKKSHAKYVVYLAEDAYPGRYWLKVAYEKLEATGSGLLSFNDGKWHGRIASFGMVRKDWISKFYGDNILSPAYKSHKADNEITVIARVTDNYVYEPESVLVEYDITKDFKGSNLDDDKVFNDRFLDGFGYKLSSKKLAALRAEYKVIE